MMQPRHIRTAKMLLGIALVLMGPAVFAGTAPSKGKTDKAAATVTNAPAAPAEIPASSFVIPASRKEGRNPFFPFSTAGVLEKPVKPGPGPDFSVFVLNGITSPPRQTAMINGRTFAAGEEGEVKVANGRKVLIKCTEIRQTSAIILVGGQSHEVRFRSGI